MLLGDFFETYYLPHIQHIKRSYDIDERLYNGHIAKFFGKLPFGKIKFGDIEKWQDSLLDKMSPDSVNRICAVLKAIYNMAERHGIIKQTNNHAHKIRVLKRNFRTRYLSKEEAKRLIERLENDNHRYADAILLILITGARKSEILNARFSDIDFENKTLTVPISKSNEPRQIELSDKAMAIIEKQKENINYYSDYIFPAITGTSKHPDIFGYWNKIRHELGLEDVRIHDLRHSYASFLVNSGHSLYVVQKLLGHKSPRTTQRYSHLDKQTLAEANNAVSELIGV